MKQNDFFLDPKEREMLISAYENIQEPPHLRATIVSRLYQKGLLRATNPLGRLQYVVAAVAALLIFFAGWFVASHSSLKQKSKNFIANNEKKAYMLLLHNPPGFIEATEQQVKEYGDWLREGIQNGTLSRGEELGPKGWLIKSTGYAMLEKEDQSDSKGTLSGYFVILASSQEEAIKVAQKCPHLKYKGLIQLRAILPN